MSFTIPSNWTAQPAIAAGRSIRGTDMETAVKNDRYTIATRRPGFAAMSPVQPVAGPVTIASLLCYRPVANRTLRMYVYGDAVDVTVSDGTASATESLPDGGGSPSGGFAQINVASTGWVRITITADVNGATPVLWFWQLVDVTLTAGQLPD